VATHDYVIANGTGAAVRSDLNGALAAIVSQNSSATEPSPTYAYQRWADTTAGVMKMRNGANSAWISLYELDGTFLASDISLAAGSAAAPSLFFTGDTNTGIYSPGADQIGIATGGTARITVDGSGNVNIDSGTFYVDAANNRVGIGTTSPSNKLHLSTAGTSYLQIENTTASNNFYVGNSAGSGVFELTGSNQFKFISNSSDRVVIDSSGKLLVGTSSGSGTNLLQIQGSTAGSAGVGGIALRRGVAPSGMGEGSIMGYLDFGPNDGGIGCQIVGIADGTQGTNDYPGRLVFSTTADGASTPTERMRITNGGALKASLAGTYDNAAGAYHELRTNGSNDWIAYFTQTTASSPNGVVIKYSGAAPNGTANTFLYCEDTVGVKAAIRSNGGLANFSANDANLSDRNAKKDISAAADTWDCLKQWEIVNYRYKDQPDDADLNLGVIAQQVAESCPEVITIFQEAKEATDETPAKEERLGVKEQQMMWMAIKALQEAQLRIETLEVEVAALKAS
jgi:hypothetical protein